MTTKTYLAVDIGSTAIGIVVMDQQQRLLHQSYGFHRGDIGPSLQELLSAVDLSSVVAVAATDSTPSQLVADRRYHSQLATIAAARSAHPGMRGLLQVGGERFYYCNFDPQGNYLGSTTNTSCAAGTGSFLDQQAGRLHLESAAQLASVARSQPGRCPQIASRCAVFAKTDLIHAQQEGYLLEEISDGLCLGLAKNVVDTLFTSRAPEGEVVFCGGVAKNQAVAHHIEKLTGISLTIPQEGHLYGALGACLLLIEDEAQNQSVRRALRRPEDLIISAVQQQREYYHPPLELLFSDYPDFTSLERRLLEHHPGVPAVEIDRYLELSSGTTYQVTLGIDIGSTSTKAVIIDHQQDVLVGLYTRTAGRPLAAVQAIFFALDTLQQEYGCHFSVVHCGTTGSGRKFIGRIVGADLIVDEITAHARAATQLDPDVDTIIEIGGQDAKFTTLARQRVTSSSMNTVCAAGTGSFIEEQAAKLGCRVEEYSKLTEGVRAPMTSDRCTVFMERDMNHLLSQGYTRAEVLASALHAVRENYLLKVATEKHIGKTVFFQGATARNKALVAAFEQKLQRPIIVSKYCHLTGALGTALIIQEEATGATTFKGLTLHQREVPISSEICELCHNHCKISVAQVADEKVAYGFLCGRDYDSTSYVAKEVRAFDLLKERKNLATTPAMKALRKLPTIGLPAAVHLVDDLHLWQHFFQQLGFPTISSERCAKPVKVGKQLSQAEFCAPMTAMHGHVHSLLARCDYVFLPLYLENKAKEVRRQFCYYTQYLPSLVGQTAGDGADKILSPLIRYLYTPFHTVIQLYRMLQKIAPDSFNFLDVSAAFDKARQHDENYRRSLKSFMSEQRQDRGENQLAVVFLGRPYTLFSPGLNSNIPGIFKDQGVDCYFQDMLSYSPDDVVAIKQLLSEVPWEHTAHILEAAEYLGKTPGLYPVLLTSFKCSPDSFTVDYFKQIMDRHQKPYLILELDEHDSSVGYETRIEAAIRAFSNHHEHKQQPASPAPFPTPVFAQNLIGKQVFLPNWDDITCRLLVAALQREGIQAHLLEETEQTIRASLKNNSGQCIPLNAIAQAMIHTVEKRGYAPGDSVLWLNQSTLACNIPLYPQHISQLLRDYGKGFEQVALYRGSLSLSDINIRACRNAYFAYMFGGRLRQVACRIRPYEREAGCTDRVLEKSVQLLCDAFRGYRAFDKTLEDVISRFEWIDTVAEDRPKVAIFGDLYSRDNPVMNQNLIRFIETHGGEVITTPYSEYAKMIAGSYIRKWFMEGKYFDMLTSKALLTAMTAMEKRYMREFNRILQQPEHQYLDKPAEILARYGITEENTGESMDNILKIHYITKHHPEISLFVQASPALCCASLITEAMRKRIEELTRTPVVCITYDGTGGNKNDLIIPYLKSRQSLAQIEG